MPVAKSTSANRASNASLESINKRAPEDCAPLFSKNSLVSSAIGPVSAGADACSKGRSGRGGSDAQPGKKRADKAIITDK